MKKTGCIAAVLMATALAGCLAEAPAEVQEAAPRLLADIHHSLPSNPVAEGADVNVVAAHADGPSALVGFPLRLEDHDWGESGGAAVETTLQIVPFGELESWALLLFRGSKLEARVVDYPSSFTPHTVDELGWTQTPHLQPINFVVRADHARSFDAVAVITGDGGLAIRPVAGRLADSDVPDWDGWKAAPMGEFPVVGRATGFTYDAYFEETLAAAVGGTLRYGNVSVRERLPETGAVSPAMFIDIEAPTGLAGWSMTKALYVGYEAQGTWEATFAGGHNETIAGTIMTHGPISVDSWVFGAPAYDGFGDTAELSSAFTVDVVNVDVFEVLHFEQLSLGTPLAALTGESRPFWLDAWTGLLDGPGPTSPMVMPHPVAAQQMR